MDIRSSHLERTMSKRRIEKLERNLPDILYDIEEYPAETKEEVVKMTRDIENNNGDSLIHVENEQCAWSENIKIEDELVQNDGNFLGDCNEIFKENDALSENLHECFQVRRDGDSVSFAEDIIIEDKTKVHTSSGTSSSSDISTDAYVAELNEICSPISSNNPPVKNISDFIQSTIVNGQNSTTSVTEELLKEDKIPTSTENGIHELSNEMMQKLLEIKIKWKQLCENIIALDENDNVEEIDKLFQGIGLSLETPKIKTEPPKETPKKENQVQSIQEIFSLGLSNRNQLFDSQQETYSQVYMRYKKNKNMITGSQIPLHRIMSTLFDPKMLQVQSMDKWLNIDNTSKRFVCGMEGVMSIVHAFSMKNELFALKNEGVRGKRPDCGPYDGLADIIWQAGDGKSAIVVQYEPQFSYTRIFECLDAKICFNINEVRSQLASLYTTPQPPISLILSVVLTRGLDRIQADLASSKIKTLLTPDGDETWSLVLLLLIGQAVGHVMHTQFPKNWDPVRSPIGILSLDEYGEKVYVS